LLSFEDLNGFAVDLTFEKQHFKKESGHVLIVLKHKGKWLLTKNPIRGIEFPGGKREVGETIVKAAIRETLEETGVTLTDVKKFAQYKVHDMPPFYKTVFTGRVLHINETYERHETDGAFWMTNGELVVCDELSFYMKDAGMTAILKWVETNES